MASVVSADTAAAVVAAKSNSSSDAKQVPNVAPLVASASSSDPVWNNVVVVGFRFRNAQPEDLLQCHQSDIHLVAEPYNQYDPCAVSVWIESRHVAYLARGVEQQQISKWLLEHPTRVLTFCVDSVFSASVRGIVTVAKTTSAK